MVKPLFTRWLATMLGVAGAVLAIPAAFAQGGPRALVAPGDALKPALLEQQGGPAGRVLAPYVGKQPVFAVYWRPKDPLSEQALVNAYNVAQTVAPKVAFLPIAALAARQSPSDIAQRAGELQLRHMTVPEDNGQLAILLGVKAVPAFVLVDAGGVVRLVGGVDVTQNAASGMSIAEALALAGQGAAVPTLGVVSSDPVYRMLGQTLPDVALTELDGATWRKLREYLAPGKSLLVFYWSPSCPHCVSLLPKLRAHFENRRSQDLVLVGIARGDAAPLRADAAKMMAGFPGVHLLDVDRSAMGALMVRETPTAFLVSPKGEVLAIRAGGDIDFERWLSRTKS